MLLKTVNMKLCRVYIVLNIQNCFKSSTNNIQFDIGKVFKGIYQITSTSKLTEFFYTDRKNHIIVKLIWNKTITYLYK